MEIVARGPQGASGSYGFVRYAQSTSSGPMTLDPGVRYTVGMTVDPTLTVNQLQGAFKNHVFWDGSIFRVHHTNDSLRVRFGLTATATVAGGTLRLDAQIVGAATPLDSQDKALPNQAGTIERLNYEIDIFSGANFAATGLQFFLTSTVSLVVNNESLKITPDFAGS